jgi:hypothetical protein
MGLSDHACCHQNISGKDSRFHAKRLTALNLHVTLKGFPRTNVPDHVTFLFSSSSCTNPLHSLATEAHHCR